MLFPHFFIFIFFNILFLFKCNFVVKDKSLVWLKQPLVKYCSTAKLGCEICEALRKVTNF